MPFQKPNTTPTPDEFFDRALQELNGAEVKILAVIIRQTFGFRKTHDIISLSQFEKKTNLNRSSVIKGLRSLEKNGWIEKAYICSRCHKVIPRSSVKTGQKDKGQWIKFPSSTCPHCGCNEMPSVIFSASIEGETWESYLSQTLRFQDNRSEYNDALSCVMVDANENQEGQTEVVEKNNQVVEKDNQVVEKDNQEVVAKNNYGVVEKNNIQETVLTRNNKETALRNRDDAFDDDGQQSSVSSLPNDIEAEIMRLLDKALLGHSELLALTELLQSGVPPGVILEGVRQAVRKYSPKHPGDKIRSFKYCVPIIRQVWSENRKKALSHHRCDRCRIVSDSLVQTPVGNLCSQCKEEFSRELELLKKRNSQNFNSIAEVR